MCDKYTFDNTIVVSRSANQMQRNVCVEGGANGTGICTDEYNVQTTIHYPTQAMYMQEKQRVTQLISDEEV